MYGARAGLIHALVVLCLLYAQAWGLARAAGAERLEVPAELWDRPRSGRVVMALPAVHTAVSTLLEQPAARLEIHHPPGPEPTLQAEELRAWLTAHAVEPRRVQLRADLPARRPLALRIVD